MQLPVPSSAVRALSGLPGVRSVVPAAAPRLVPSASAAAPRAFQGEVWRANSAQMANVAEISANTRAALANKLSNPANQTNFRKALVGAGVVGAGAAGFGINELIDAWAALPPAERVEIAGGMMDPNAPGDDPIYLANNELAAAGREVGVQQYAPNMYGETHLAADTTLDGSAYAAFFDPAMHEMTQLIQSTYELVRARDSLQLILARQFLSNNLTQEQLNVCEERYLASRR